MKTFKEFILEMETLAINPVNSRQAIPIPSNLKVKLEPFDPTKPPTKPSTQSSKPVTSNTKPKPPRNDLPYRLWATGGLNSPTAGLGL
jgi:hypothetical protein